MSQGLKEVGSEPYEQLGSTFPVGRIAGTKARKEHVHKLKLQQGDQCGKEDTSKGRTVDTKVREVMEARQLRALLAAIKTYRDASDGI